MTRGQRLRPVSTRRAAAQRERTARLRRTTHGPERCQWPTGCVNEASDAHESLSRARGGNPIDPNWLLCRLHHDTVTSASGWLLDWATSQGLIRSASPRDADVDNALQRYTLHPMSDADRTQIAVRLSTAGLARVDAIAATEERSRSDMIRKLLSEAIHARDIAAAKKGSA
jgi:hypothetical protein